MDWRQGALRLVEQTLNRVLSLDPDTPARLRPLIGRRLQVRLRDPAATLMVEFAADGLRLSQLEIDVTEPGVDTPPVDARLTATLAGLAALASSGGRRGQGVHFEGDVGVIQEVRHLFSELDVDWEEPLARLTGDVIAHQLGNAARGGSSWLRRAGETLLMNLGEYLTEERRLMPTAIELEAFVTDVDRLRADADRLEARMRRLERRRGGEGA
jgi:ubiquinone biosynthesis protein UbiJ